MKHSDRALIVSVWAVAAIMHGRTVKGADQTTQITMESTINACELLSISEISLAVGRPASQRAPNDAGFEADGTYSSTCVWEIRPDSEAPRDPTAPLDGKSFVILNAIKWPEGRRLARRYLEAFRSAAVAGEISGVPTPKEFGEESLGWEDGLAVSWHDVGFGVSVFLPGLSKAERVAIAEQLAPRVLMRLKNEALAEHRVGKLPTGIPDKFV